MMWFFKKDPAQEMETLRRAGKLQELGELARKQLALPGGALLVDAEMTAARETGCYDAFEILADRMEERKCWTSLREQLLAACTGGSDTVALNHLLKRGYCEYFSDALKEAILTVAEEAGRSLVLHRLIQAACMDPEFTAIIDGAFDRALFSNKPNVLKALAETVCERVTERDIILNRHLHAACRANQSDAVRTLAGVLLSHSCCSPVVEVIENMCREREKGDPVLQGLKDALLCASPVRVLSAAQREGHLKALDFIADSVPEDKLISQVEEAIREKRFDALDVLVKKIFSKGSDDFCRRAFPVPAPPNNAATFGRMAKVCSIFYNAARHCPDASMARDVWAEIEKNYDDSIVNDLSHYILMGYAETGANPAAVLSEMRPTVGSVKAAILMSSAKETDTGAADPCLSPSLAPYFQYLGVVRDDVSWEDVNMIKDVVRAASQNRDSGSELGFFSLS